MFFFLIFQICHYGHELGKTVRLLASFHTLQRSNSLNVIVLNISTSSFPCSQVDAEAIRSVMGKIGFKFTYLASASAKPKTNYFDKKKTPVVDSTNGGSSGMVEKSSDVKNVELIALREMLAEGELFDKIYS